MLEEPRGPAKMAARPDTDPPATPQFRVFSLDGQTVLAGASPGAVGALLRDSPDRDQFAVVLESEALDFAKGYQARLDNRMMDESPYPVESVEGDVWVGGWMCADKFLLETNHE